MDELDSAVITSISHGHTETLLKSGLRAEWIYGQDAKTVYLAAVDCLQSQDARTPNRINVLTKTWGQLIDAEGVKSLFSLNGTGDVSPKDVVSKLRNRYLIRQAQQHKDSIDRLIARNPNDVSKWLPEQARNLLALSLTGRAYNPRPSAHKGSIVAPVMFKSQIPTLNKMFEGLVGDGGGYRSGWYNVWIGTTGHGKSTLAYSIVWDCISQGKHVAIVTKENQNQVRGRVLWALTHLTRKEIDDNKGYDVAPLYDSDGNAVKLFDNDGKEIGEWHKAESRQWLLEQWEKAIEKLLTIWDWNFFHSEAIRGIISTENPDVVLVDYISAADVANAKDVKVGLGAISQKCENIAHETGRNIHTFWQMSNDDARRYMKSNRHVVIGPYGSGMVSHAADQVGQTKRDNAPGKQHILMTKDRASNPYAQYWLAYDETRWVYTDTPQPSPNLDTKNG